MHVFILLFFLIGADEFSRVDGRIEGLPRIDLDVYLVAHWVMLSVHE